MSDSKIALYQSVFTYFVDHFQIVLQGILWAVGTLIPREKKLTIEGSREDAESVVGIAISNDLKYVVWQLNP